ncbi:MAG: DUF1206 domain-containing protein, partial [Bacteroidota bacterium]
FTTRPMLPPNIVRQLELWLKTFTIMIEKIRKTGLLTKGFVYVLIGLLTLLAVLNVGGQVAGKSKLIGFLKDQPFGKFLLLLLTLGLLCYAAWRLCSAFLDTKNEGTDKKALARRTAWFFSGLAYAAFGISALRSAFGNGGSGGDNKEQLVGTLLNQSYGELVLYVVAAIFAGVAVYQFYKGASKKFMEEIDEMGSIESSEALEKSGMLGYIARGVAFAIFAFFIIRASIEQNANNIRGVEGLFNFLHQQAWGNVLMGLMAFGLLCYGVFQYFLARYSKIYT